MSSEYKLVIFDCDGVLVDSEGIANRTFAEEVRKHGVPFSDAEAQANFPGTTLAKCISYVENKYNVSLPADIGDKYRTASLEAFSREMKAVPDVEEVLKSLNINCCVASNGPKAKMIHNLKIVDFLKYFDDQLYSAYDIELFKPDPGIFFHAAKELQIAPEQCIVIEDSIHGFEAGVSAGMKVLAYEPMGTSKNPIDGVSYYSSMEEIYRNLNEIGICM